MRKLKSIVGRLRPAKPDRFYDKKALDVGTKIEMEHTRSKKVAKRIAKHHIDELGPEYYDSKIGLPAMERKLERIKKNKNKKK